MGQDHNPMENASWQETLLIIWIVFQTLAIPLGFMLGTMGLLVWFFMAIFSNPWTALVPVALGSFVIWLFIRKDREAAAKLIAERDGLTGPGAPRRPGL